LIFDYPDLYYLDVNLYYRVDKDKGSAKYTKGNNTLVIVVPVVGLTEDSRKVMEANYKKFLDAKANRRGQAEVEEDIGKKYESEGAGLSTPLILTADGSEDKVL